MGAYLIYRPVVMISLVSALFLSIAWGGTPEIDIKQSEIRFAAQQMHVPIAGKFKSFTGDLQLDSKRQRIDKVSLHVDLSSIDLNDADTNQEVTRPNWFNTKAFPAAVFESTKIEAINKETYRVGGRLTIKGITKEVSLSLQLKPVAQPTVNNQVQAIGEFTIKRLDFKIGEGDWADTNTVADEVIVRFRFLITDFKLS